MTAIVNLVSNKCNELLRYENKPGNVKFSKESITQIMYVIDNATKGLLEGSRKNEYSIYVKSVAGSYANVTVVYQEVMGYVESFDIKSDRDMDVVNILTRFINALGIASSKMCWYKSKTITKTECNALLRLIDDGSTDSSVFDKIFDSLKT